MCQGGFSACPHVCVPRCTCACPSMGAHACLHVRLCTCGSGLWPESCWGGMLRAHKSAGQRGRDGAGGLLVAIQLTAEVPRAQAGKSGAEQSSHYVPGLSQGCLAQRALPRRLGRGSERRAPPPSPAPRSSPGDVGDVPEGLRPPCGTSQLCGEDAERPLRGAWCCRGAQPRYPHTLLQSHLGARGVPRLPVTVPHRDGSAAALSLGVVL